MGMSSRLVVALAVLAPMGLSAGRAAAATIFSEDFSDNSAGWILSPEWQIGSATASTGHAYGNPDPASDHTATPDNGVAGVVIGGNADTFSVHPFYYLASPAFDATGYDGVSLEFYRWLNSDYEPFMVNQVQAYDGITWQTLWQTGAAPGVTDSDWTLQTFDLTPYANPNTAVRFGFKIDSSNVMAVSGWNLDDVAVIGTVPEPAAATTALALAALAASRRRSRSLAARPLR